MAELLVTIAVLGILAAITAVAAATYLPGLQVRWAARELQTTLNRAKMLAVTTRQFTCIDVFGTGVRFRQGATQGTACAGAIWTGTGTDTNGMMAASGQTTVARVSAGAPIFSQFGTAVVPGQFTINRPGNPRLTSVTVTAAGQVTIP
jgi:Tfp pilus assembly protein FimT